jgi:branched-chain amino acid transport system substrate-binding protein
VYVSLPLTGPRAAEGRDAADGARLALEQAGNRAGDLQVEATVLDDARGRAWDPVAVGENARTAIQDSSTVAYVGELDSEPTRSSVPLTNEAGILQVSPGAGAVDLTRAAEGYPDSPDLHRPSGEPTFARVVPDDAVQARAAAELAVERGASRVAVETGDGPFGDLMAAEFEGAAAGVGVEVAAKGETAPTRFTADAAGGPVGLAGEFEVEVASVVDPAGLPSAAFAGEFRERFGRDPGAYAAYGYEAMDVALDAIAAAEVDSQDGFRQEVVDGALGAARPDAVLGPYEISDAGDSTLCAVQPYELRGGERIAAAPLCPPG